MFLPLTPKPANEVPCTVVRLLVNCRTPKSVDRVSEVDPATVAATSRWYSSGLPNWYGHHSAGLARCSCGNAAGVKATSRRSCAASVTLWLTVTFDRPALLIVPLTVVVTAAPVALRAST